MTVKTPTDELLIAIRADIFRALEAIPPVERSVESMAAAATRVLSSYQPTPDFKVQVEVRGDRELNIEFSIVPSRYTISGVVAPAENINMAVSNTPRMPSGEQCTARAPVDGGIACWYPQMGGYVGKCVVVPDLENGCFTAYVWHDGDFPFADTDGEPAVLHHCDPQQFIDFGMFVQSLYKGKKP